MEIKKAAIDRSKLNTKVKLPYELRLADFEMAMQDIYDFFFDVNQYLLGKGLQRLDEMLRPANLSGTLSDMLTDALAKHSRTLTPNLFHNGHPDLIVRDRYPNNMIKAGEDGVEIKSTRKSGGAVDTHGARTQTLCVFVYEVDNDRGKKLDEHTFYVALRIGARAKTKTRATHLATRIVKALKSTQGASNYFVDRWWVRGVQKRMDTGASPEPGNMLNPPIVLNVSELTAFLGWRLGDPLISGLTPTAARSLPATEAIPQDGCKIGRSTFPGRERMIALPYAERTKHVWTAGGTGSGKTTLLTNMLMQDMAHGNGTIVIESKRDLFYKALDCVPADQIGKTIVIDFSDQSFATGFNVLQQGNHAVAVDNLNVIFNNLFEDRQSMWMQMVLYHALQTLAQDKQGTFMDVLPLIMPKESEREWSAQLKRTVADRDIRNWWVEFDKDPRRDQKIDPLVSRLWPMMRSNLINVFGQSQSGFSMADVIKNHMHLFINLAGLEEMSKRLAGTIFTKAVWQAVQANPVALPNFLYVDEFQDFLRLIDDAEDMLAKSRSFGLGLVLANQHLAQLTDSMRDAIMSNAHTKVVFQAGDPRDASRLAASFGKAVTPDDFVGLNRYEALARIATDAGDSPPLTLATLPPMQLPGHADRVRYASRANYARRVDEVREAMDNKRASYTTVKQKLRPTISGG